MVSSEKFEAKASSSNSEHPQEEQEQSNQEETALDGCVEQRTEGSCSHTSGQSQIKDLEYKGFEQNFVISRLQLEVEPSNPEISSSVRVSSPCFSISSLDTIRSVPNATLFPQASKLGSQTDVADLSDGQRSVGVACGLLDVSRARRTLLEILAQEMEDSNGILPWLQALDMQLVGACRADERLRPLLRWNVSCFGANGQLLAHLGLHFKAKELSMIARCLLVPLVSLRVGKVITQGRLLHPTAIRGHITLTMLPTSELRLSFTGDNGATERLALIASTNGNPPVILEEIGADSSGRTFVFKLPGDQNAYFWQSEKSRQIGNELMTKLKDLLIRRPSLAQLTGISETRLHSFGSYLQSALLVGSSSSCMSSAVSTRTSESAIIPPSSSVLSVACPPSQQSMPCETVSPPLYYAGLGITGVSKSDVPILGSAAIGRSLAMATEIFGRLQNASSSSLVAPTVLTDWNSSWSTRTSLCIEKSEGNDSSTSSEEEMSYSDVTRRFFQSNSGLQSSPIPQNLLPSLLSTSSAGSCTFLPPISSRLPISTSSFLSPSYCPCPLRSVSALQCTFTPPYLPSIMTQPEFLSSSPLLSVDLPAPLLPPMSIGVHELHYSIPFPDSLLSCTIPQTSSTSPLFNNTVAKIPVVSLHLESEGVTCSAIPSTLQQSSSDIHQILSSSHGSSELIKGLIDNIECDIFKNIIRGRPAGFPELMGMHEVGKSSESPIIVPRCRGSAVDNVLHMNLPPQHSGPMLGIVPGVLSSSTLSRVISFCPDRVTATANRLPACYGSICTLGPQQIPSSGGSSQACLTSTSDNIGQASAQDFLSSRGLSESTMFHDKGRNDDKHTN